MVTARLHLIEMEHMKLFGIEVISMGMRQPFHSHDTETEV